MSSIEILHELKIDEDDNKKNEVSWQILNHLFKQAGEEVQTSWVFSEMLDLDKLLDLFIRELML